MAWAGTTKLIDNFDRAQEFSTTPGHNGWTIADTSASGSPTYKCATEDGGAAALTLDGTSEAEIVTLYQKDVLALDVRKLHQVWWVAKVAAIDAVTTLVLGIGSARNDNADSVGVNAWFRLHGSGSTSALLYETDDGTIDNDDKPTGKTLADVYRRLLIDFTQGLGNVRFFVDGDLVGTADMSKLPAGQNVQPIVQLQKASGTGVPSVSIAQYGVSYSWSYGV